jgi:transcriptional regulator with XRE-family HTH domain
MDSTFNETVTKLRKRLGLTNTELAAKAGIPRSLVAGIQSGKRVIGERNARQLGVALELSGVELERFIYQALNNASDRVIEDMRGYPAQVINHLGKFLRKSRILPEDIVNCGFEGDSKVVVYTANGERILLETLLVRT